MNLAEEQAFLQAYQQGGVRPEELLEQYYKVIRFFIYKKVNPNVADDAYQEACIKLFSIVKDFDVSRNLKFVTFLLSSLRNIVRDFNHNERIYQERYKSLDEFMENGFDYAENVKELKGESDFKVRFRIAVSSLTLKEKRVIILRYFKEKSYKEISKILNIPIGSISAIERSSIRKLRTALTMENEYEEIFAGI